jgi:hypothetical protein
MEYTRQQLTSKPAHEELMASPMCAGEWVQVRSREEILATLDEHGRLEGMPFMPEMLSFCGRTLPVFKRAHKTCDTIGYSGIRKIERTIHLVESRCDGSAHGGCQAACSLYWNEAWVKPAAAAPSDGKQPQRPTQPQRARGCSMEQLMAAMQQGQDPEKGPRYVCQATEILNASKPMSGYDMRQYIEDYRSGNVDLATLARGTVYRVTLFLSRRAERIGRRLGLGDALVKMSMACYDALQRLLPNGVPFPRRKGTIPVGQSTPDGTDGIRPGSRVRVKPYREILATLNTANKTRGLYFDAEHVPYCGKEFTVRSLVNQIIDERTGYMMHFKSPSIILHGAYCQGTFSDGRMFCPRAIYPYWRTVWLNPLDGERSERENRAGDQRAG